MGVELRAKEEECPDSALGPGFEELPEDCIAFILRLTAPSDVARVACVSRVFRASAESDSVWERMLPPSSATMLARIPDPPLQTRRSKKAVYNFLCHPVLLENGTRQFWLDRATGEMCHGLGARGLRITWGDTPDYWEWGHRRQGSRFAEIAYLHLVWWLAVQGKLECALSPGTYTLSWRVLVLDEFKKCALKPVRFTFEATGNVPVITEFDFSKEQQAQGQGQQQLSCRKVHDGWMEVDVGEFTVEKRDSPVLVEFSMKETDCRVRKEGLYLDGVVIRPTRLIRKNERINRVRRLLMTIFS